MPTQRQQKLIKLIVENLGAQGNTKSMQKLMLSAGYSEAQSKNPYQILESETMQEELSGFLDQIDKKRKLAVKHITEVKLKKSSARDLSSINETLTKTHQLLKGEPTEINKNTEVATLREDINKLIESVKANGQ